VWACKGQGRNEREGWGSDKRARVGERAREGESEGWQQHARCGGVHVHMFSMQ